MSKNNDGKVKELRKWLETEKSQRGLVDMELFIHNDAGIEEVAAEVLSVVKDKSNNSVRIKSNEDF